MKSLGTHILIDLYGCNASMLNDLQKIHEMMMAAATLASIHVVKMLSHQFSPQGITAIFILAESHFAIHTWPEYGCASMDIFSCSGELPQISKALTYVKEALQCSHMTQRPFDRCPEIPVSLDM